MIQPISGGIEPAHIADQSNDAQGSTPGLFQRIVDKASRATAGWGSRVAGVDTNAPFPLSLFLGEDRRSTTRARMPVQSGETRDVSGNRPSIKKLQAFAHATADAITKNARDLSKDPPRKLTKRAPKAAQRRTPRPSASAAALISRDPLPPSELDLSPPDAIPLQDLPPTPLSGLTIPSGRMSFLPWSPIDGEQDRTSDQVEPAPLTPFEAEEAAFFERPPLRPEIVTSDFDIGAGEPEVNPPGHGLTQTEIDDGRLAAERIKALFPETYRRVSPMSEQVIGVVTISTSTAKLPVIELTPAPPSPYDHFVKRLLAMGSGDEPRYGKTWIIAKELADATSGDWERANRVLDVLSNGLSHLDCTENHPDAFAAQLGLSTDGLGLDALLELSPRRFDDETSQMNYRYAVSTAARTGRYLLARLPRSERRPTSLMELQAIAEEMLFDDSRGSHTVDEVTKQAAIAFLAALTIIDEPAAELEMSYRMPYFEWKNRLVGEGYDDRALAKKWIYKGLIDDALRAAAPDWRMLSRGLNKRSPALALDEYGMLGAHLGHLKNEYEKVRVAFRSLIEGIRESSTRDRQSIDKEVRAAVLEQVLARTETDGWEEHMSIDEKHDRWRSWLGLDEKCLVPIARFAADRCGVEQSEVERHDAFRALKKASNRTITTALLIEWARASGMAVDADTELAQKLDALQMADLRGGVPKESSWAARAVRNTFAPPSSEQTVQQARRRIDDLIKVGESAPENFWLRLEDGPDFGAGGGTALVFPPFFGVGPNAQVGNSRLRVTTVGSNRTHAVFTAGEERTLYGQVGVGAGMGPIFKVLEKLQIKVNPGYSYVPLGYEQHNFKGAQIVVERDRYDSKVALKKRADVMRHISATASGKLPSADEVWKRLCTTYSTDPTVAASIRSTEETIRYSIHALNAGPRIMWRGAGWGVAPELTRVYRKGTLGGGDRTAFAARSGALGNDTATTFEKTVWNANVNANVASPFVSFGANRLPQGVMPPVAPLAGESAKIWEDTVRQELNIGRKNDRIDASQAWMDYLFSSAEAFADHILRYRSEIVDALGGTDDARKKLQDFLNDDVLTEGLKRNNRLFLQANGITAKAASRIDSFEAMIARHARDRQDTKARREISRLTELIQEVLENPESWEVAALAVVEFGDRGTQESPLPVYLRRITAARTVREISALPIKGRPLAPATEDVESATDSERTAIAPTRADVRESEPSFRRDENSATAYALMT